MPNVKVYNMAGAEVGALDLSEKLFGAEVNVSVLHQAVKMYLVNQRQGTQSTLTRTEVSGGGKKPWRQKGTGRARQGSTRSPQWTHGGIALGPKPRDYRITMNKKVKRLALYSALSARAASGDLILVDSVNLDSYEKSTSKMVAMFKALGCEKTYEKEFKVYKLDENGELIKGEKGTRTATKAQTALLVLPEVNAVVVKGCANIPEVKTTLYSTLNVYDIMNAEKLVMTVDAVKKLEEVYA
ncbi:MAG: 50S ribosomal protein L4 [Clostridia bacterium]|nr:50S ribosomal protein L4 [Clostridia bacterium]